MYSPDVVALTDKASSNPEMIPFGVDHEYETGPVTPETEHCRSIGILQELVSAACTDTWMLGLLVQTGLVVEL